MRKRELRTVEDLFSAPEGEWFEVLGPNEVEILDETTEGIDTGLRIRVSPSLVRKHRLRAGEKLSAEYVRGHLVVKRQPSRRSRRSA